MEDILSDINEQKKWGEVEKISSDETRDKPKLKSVLANFGNQEEDYELAEGSSSYKVSPGNEPDICSVELKCEEESIFEFPEDGVCRIRSEAEEDECKIEEYICHLCDFTTSRRDFLRDHIGAEHSKLDSYNCSHCNFKTNKSGSLKRHIHRFHLNIKYLKCRECNYKTNEEFLLEKHIDNVHSNFTPLTCSLSEYEKTNKQKLSLHITKVNLNSVTVNCSHCDYEAQLSGTLKKHLDSHLKVKKLKCLQCDYQTKRNDSMNYHVKNKHLKQPSNCSQCYFKAIDKRSLKKHAKEKHLNIEYFRYTECEHERSGAILVCGIPLCRARTNIYCAKLNDPDNLESNIGKKSLLQKDANCPELPYAPAMLENELFKNILMSEKSTVLFLRKYNLIDSVQEADPCYKCGSVMQEKRKRDRGGEFRPILRCPLRGCQTSRSLRKGNNFFGFTDMKNKLNSNLALTDILELVFYFVKETPLTTTLNLTLKSMSTISEWFNMCRQVCGVIVSHSSRGQMVGSDEKPIKIDELRFAGRSKSRRDKHLGDNCHGLSLDSNGDIMLNVSGMDGPWVFGLKNGTDYRYFYVERHDRDTLIPIIQRECKVGSVIQSNESPAYSDLTKVGYQHKIVNQEEFMNSTLDEHVAGTERLWLDSKIEIMKKKRTVTARMMQSYLDHYCWQILRQEDDLFLSFLNDIRTVYR